MAQPKKQDQPESSAIPGVEDFMEAMEQPQQEGERKTDAIKRIWQEDPELTPNQVVAELARRGLTVSRPMVYKVKQEMLRTRVATQSPTYDELMELKRLAEQFGGLDRLKLMCEMLEQLQV